MGPSPAEVAAGAADRLKGMDLSHEEVNKFEKAFKDPEFLKLFSDYVNEIKDPKVMEETDTYLRQIEMEGRVEEVYGKGVQLITPKEAFVFKTMDTKTQRKAFINVCTCEKVSPVTTRREAARQGMHVELPFHTGPMKKGKDKHGAECPVWDVVVHPDTLKMVLVQKPVKDMLADMAMAKIESVSKDVQLDRRYRIPKLTYKVSEGAAKPPTLALRAPGAGEVVDGLVKPKQAADPVIAEIAAGQKAAVAARAAAASTGKDGGAQSNGGSRSKFSFGSGKGAHQGALPTNADLKPHQAGYVHETGETTPVWEVVHRGEVDLTAAWGDAGRGLTINTTHPKELLVRFHLPGLTSAAECDLNVDQQAIALVVAGRYRLPSTALPFAVDTSAGKAKFVRASQKLEVTLTVLPPPPPKQLPHRAEEPTGAGDEVHESTPETGPTSSHTEDFSISPLPQDPASTLDHGETHEVTDPREDIGTCRPAAATAQELPESVQTAGQSPAHDEHTQAPSGEPDVFTSVPQPAAAPQLHRDGDGAELGGPGFDAAAGGAPVTSAEGARGAKCLGQDTTCGPTESGAGSPSVVEAASASDHMHSMAVPAATCASTISLSDQSASGGVEKNQRGGHPPEDSMPGGSGGGTSCPGSSEAVHPNEGDLAMTENERRWREVHARRAAELGEPSCTKSAEQSLVTKDHADQIGGSPAKSSLRHDGQEAPLAYAPPAVQLKPRLKSSVAEELD